MSRAVLCLVTVGLTVTGCSKGTPAPPAPPTSQPTTHPTSQPATTKAAVELKTLLDVVRANDSHFPTTQPVNETLEYSAAARLHIAEPVFLDARGDLWITRADAPETAKVLASAVKPQTHVTREHVAFVFWRPVKGEVQAELISREGTQDSWVTSTARLGLDPKPIRDWSRAGTWTTDDIQAAVVPTTTGISVIRIDHGVVYEQQVQLLDVASPGSSTQYTLDPRGLLAWSIDPTGPSKVARYLDGKWTLLTPDPAWPEKLVHIVPFLDGTVLAIGQKADTLQLKSVAIETIAVNEPRVTELVKQLVNRDPKIREKAQVDLAAIGPGAWPLLRKLAPTQPPEARIRIRAVLGNESTPTLSGIAPLAGPARVVTRIRNGIVLCFDAGASAVNPNGVVQTFAPAWLAVRSDRPTQQLSDALAEELAAPQVKPVDWPEDEWIVEHDVDGPKRLMGNHTEPLLKKTEIPDFKHFGGIDGVGRWIFKTIDPNGPTLIVDPTLPDPKPRLPVWTFDVNSNTVGWNDDNWAMMRRGGAWILKEGGWQPFHGDADAGVHTTLPTRIATSKPATTQAEIPLLVDSDGNRYFDGKETLRVETKDGRHLTWTLPPEAVGTGAVNGEPVLIEAEGKLFLCNAPGKLQRISKQFGDAEPFHLDAVFSRNIPGSDIRRIWKDPPGRIIFASGGNKLSIAFPSGRIPNSLSTIMTAETLRQALEDEGD